MLSNVAFSYDKSKGVIFKDVDLSATMESRICIVSAVTVCAADLSEAARMTSI